MYKGVKEVLTNNSNIHSSIPVIGEALSSLTSIINSIEEVNFDFRKATKGSTSVKIDKEEKLIDTASRLANVLYVYAVRTNNKALQTDFKVSKSDLEKLRDTDLPNKANQIINSAESHKEELVNYGVTDDTITAARTALDEFNSAFNSQAEKMAERSADREKFTGLFEDADSVLYNELDPMIELFMDTNPEFYNRYQSARVIKDLGAPRKESEETEAPVE